MTVYRKCTIATPASLIICLLCSCIFGLSVEMARADQNYTSWRKIGQLAASEALALMQEKGVAHRHGRLIALTNAGYAEVQGQPTMAALDGLAAVTGVSRGNNTLVEVHSSNQTPLWFAVFANDTGMCAYLQVKPEAANAHGTGAAEKLFSHRTVLRIDAKHLFANSDPYKQIFAGKPFAGNEFRIITIANAVAQGALPAAVRAFEFHDHFCPGVSSGILMAAYLKQHFPPQGGGYFVHGVDPWCKEDALMVLLNTTPGKKGYAVHYPNEADKARRLPEAKDAATIVYRETGKSKTWQGLVLGFHWGETDCPKTGNDSIDKLCTDLWFLRNASHPEKFVKVIKEFTMPEGSNPTDWARPGVDPLQELQLLQQ